MDKLIEALQPLGQKSYEEIIAKILDHQLNTLIKNNFIDQNGMGFIRGEIISMKDNVHRTQLYSFPFIICPNKITIKSIFAAIDLGNKQGNSFFLREEHIFNEKTLNCENEFTLVKDIPSVFKFMDGTRSSLKKSPSAKTNKLIFPDIMKLTLREVACLLLFYPDILRFWDGVFAGGSYWQINNEQKNSLRFYRMNNWGKYCFVKIAREVEEIFDERIYDPTCGQRSVLY